MLLLLGRLNQNRLSLVAVVRHAVNTSSELGALYCRNSDCCAGIFGGGIHGAGGNAAIVAARANARRMSRLCRIFVVWMLPTDAADCVLKHVWMRRTLIRVLTRDLEACGITVNRGTSTKSRGFAFFRLRIHAPVHVASVSHFSQPKNSNTIPEDDIYVQVSTFNTIDPSLMFYASLLAGH